MEMRFSLTVGERSVEFKGSRAVYDEVAAPIVEVLTAQMSQSDVAAATGRSSAEVPRSPLQMTVKAVAQKLAVTKGSDLLKACAAHFVLVERRETFSRSDLIEAMKTATGYFKNTYVSNLTNYLTRLGNEGVLIEVSKETYALSAMWHARLEKELAAAT